MKPTLIIVIVICSTALCSGQSSDHGIEVKFKKLEWLVGTWNRTNISKPGRSSHERWEKHDEFELSGIGITLQGLDTIFVEKISILMQDNSIYYVADVPENKQPVYFKLIEITDTGFVAENSNHDFPKRIVYQLEGVNLKAQISGDGKSIDYLFKKQ